MSDTTLIQRLRESADEVMSAPHPSHCDHLHSAFHVMRQAADALEQQAAQIEAYKCSMNRLHHLLAANGWHPGRTEGDIIDILAAGLNALRADAERLRGACQNARDIIATDRQSFVDCQRLRDTRTESPIEHGLVWVDEDTWVTPDDAEALHDYDRALALIDAALRQEQPNE